MKIGTLAASATTTINLTWVPQYVFFIAATVPTAFKVNVYGDGVISDIDGNGCTALNSIRLYGAVTNGYLLPVANGLLKGKNTDITITNAVAATVDVYGLAFNAGYAYVQMIRQYLLANSGAEFNDFAYIAFPSAAAGDLYQVTFRDGTTHLFTYLELNAALGLTQVPITSRYNVDNLNGQISLLQATPAAAQTAYLVRYIPVGGVAESAVFGK